MSLSSLFAGMLQGISEGANMKTGKKTIVLASTLVLAAALVLVVLFTQLISPLKYSFVEAVTYKYVESDDYSGILETDYRNAREGTVSDIQLLSDKDYNFGDPNDFTNIILFYDVTNTSIFEINSIDFFVLDLGGIEDRFMCKLDHIVGQSASPGHTTQIRFDIYMYTKGLSEDDMAAMTKKLKIELRYIYTVVEQPTRPLFIGLIEI
jgi:hypothetical protein